MLAKRWTPRMRGMSAGPKVPTEEPPLPPAAEKTLVDEADPMPPVAAPATPPTVVVVATLVATTDVVMVAATDVVTVAVTDVITVSVITVALVVETASMSASGALVSLPATPPTVASSLLTSIASERLRRLQG